MSLEVKIHNDLLNLAKEIKLQRIYFNGSTNAMTDGDPSDVVPLKMWQCAPIAAAWEDSGNRLENAPKDMVQWTWQMNAGYPAHVVTRPFFEAFETPTWFPADAELGTPAYRVELIEADVETPPFGGQNSTSTTILATLNVEILRR